MLYKNVLLKPLLLLLIAFSCASHAEQVLLAGSDFKKISSNNISYYYDKGRSALAIDASRQNYRNVYAAAKWVNNKAEGKVRATLVTLSETDGESLYRVSINDKLLGEFKNPETTTDYKPAEFDVGIVELKPGDAITVQSMAVTNGKIPEGDGTAFARGRWQSLKLTPIN